MTNQEAYLRFQEQFNKKLHTILRTGNLVFMVMRKNKSKEFELVDINVFRHPTSHWVASFDLMNYVEFICKKHRIPIPGARSYAGAEHVVHKGAFIETGDPNYRLYYGFLGRCKQPCGCMAETDEELVRLMVGDTPYCEHCFLDKHNIKIQDIL